MSGNDTWTPEGQSQRMNEIVLDYTRAGNGRALVRLIGGSIEDFDERYDSSMSGSHPDDIRS